MKLLCSVNMHIRGTFIFFQDEVIQQDDEIRLKIVGTRVDAKDIVSDLHVLTTVADVEV